MKRTAKTNRLKVFLPNARLLSEAERSQLPVEKKYNAATDEQGLWIEVDCPQDACAIEGSTVTLPAGGVAREEAQGIWLSLFCPQNQCVIDEYTDLP